MTKVVLLSGGMDSTCALWDIMANKGDNVSVRCVWIDYGQVNAKQEEKSAEQCAEALGVELQKLHISGLFSFSTASILSLTSKDDVTVANAEIRHRNAVLIMVAAANTPYPDETEDYVVAAHKTSAPYADATRPFYTKMSKLLSYSSNGRQSCSAPYINCTKLQLARKGWDAGMSRIDFTHSMSCYKGTNCGLCPACKNREFVMKRIFG